MYRNLFLLGVAAIMGVSAPTNAAMVRESFNAGLGQFDLVVNVPGGDNDFGFSNTSYAGGSAGELGGTVARTMPDPRYVADGTLGGELTTNEELTMSGQFLLEDINYDGYFFLGWFNTANVPQRNAHVALKSMGLFFMEPGGASGGAFRLNVCAGGFAVGRDGPPYAPQNQVVHFHLTFTPSGSGDGSGTLSAKIGDQDVTLEVGANEDVYNAFGLAAGYDNNTDARKANVYFDNLKYTAVVAAGGDVADDPSPADGATDVPRDAILSWAPGESAATHDVYMGASFDDVNEADTTNPLGVLVSPSQDANSYDPEGPLELGQTYYWRVDEVNDSPDLTVHKGTTWSFTVEPVAIPLFGSLISATASSADSSDTEAGKTIDGSGLIGRVHSQEPNDMWLSANEPNGAWIEYTFDKPYKMHAVNVWNHNTDLENHVGFGIKEAAIAYTLDGESWIELGVRELARGTLTPVDLQDMTATAVRITAQSNWGGLFDQYGLSEVQFEYIPTYARQPDPEPGSVMLPDAVLTWRAGREATLHDVYVGADAENLALADAVSGNGYDTTALDLQLGETYYWKVTEVNDVETPGSWEGPIWSFTTPDYFIVDDFESYDDDYEDGGAIWQAWIDGLTDPQNGGSQVGYGQAPFAERTIVRGGKQSMPLEYSGVSEATRTFSPAQNWNRAGIQTLTLFFHGAQGNTGQLYVKINGKEVVYPGATDVIARPRWRQWNIDLASVGVDLQNVVTLSIGIGGNGAGGILYLDDIRLYRLAPEPPVEMWFEAEAADNITEPMKIYADAAASGGQYIAAPLDIADSSDAPPAEGGVAAYTFTVQGGVYRIAGRVNRVEGDSFWIRVLDAAGQMVPTNTANHASGWVRWNSFDSGWHWQEVFSADDAGDPTVEFTLSPGTYTLQIAYRETGTLLDAFVITDKVE